MRSKSSSVYIADIRVEIDQNAESGKPITFLQSLESEVKAKPQQAKKLTKLMSTTGTMFSAILFTSLAPQVGTMEIDTELKEIFITTMLIVVALAFMAAIVAGMLAGVWKMFPFFGGKQADSWNVDILKGFTQVLAAPIIIGIIVVLFSLLFGKLTLFNPVENAIQMLLK